MRHSQTVCIRASPTLAGIGRNGDNTVWTLRTLVAPGEDSHGEGELKVFHTSLTCLTLWNSVESVDHSPVGRGVAPTAILLGIGSSASRR